MVLLFVSYQDACLRNLTSAQVLAGQYGVQGDINYFHPLLLFLPWTPIGMNITNRSQ